MTAKYDRIGNNYNLTRKADTYLTERLCYYLNPKDGGQYVDIGCGTGNYTNGLQKKGIYFTGIDPSTTMLEQARKKNPTIEWMQGQAENCGLPSSNIDGIIASLTIHHWLNLELGFKEMYRIMKKGGNMVIFTATPKQMRGYWLMHYFPKMMEASIHQMPTFKSVSEAMSSAGFSITATEPYVIQPDLEDLFLYSGKHDPEMYFRPEVRNGISSFSGLALAGEIETGLENLRRDIDNGEVHEVMKHHENETGDYLFIVGEKN